LGQSLGLPPPRPYRVRKSYYENKPKHFSSGWTPSNDEHPKGLLIEPSLPIETSITASSSPGAHNEENPTL
jgi:hypothetical protein